MKKTLTEDISRYDEKMRLRMDKKTVRAIAVSLLPSLFTGGILWRISPLVALPAAVPLFLVLLLLQIGTVDGMPLTGYIAAILRLSGRKRLPYLYAGRGEEILPAPYREESEKNGK